MTLGEPTIIYDLTGWQRPDGCVLCFFFVGECVINMRCPVHGMASGPVINEGDLPPMRVVYT